MTELGSKEVFKTIKVGLSPPKANTLPKTNIDPDNGPLEDCFPLPTSGFPGSMASSSRCTVTAAPIGQC